MSYLLGTFLSTTLASAGIRMALTTFSSSIPPQVVPYIDDVRQGLLAAVQPMVRSYIPL